MFRELMQKLRGGGGDPQAAAEVSEDLHEERVNAGTVGGAPILPDGDVPDWSAGEEAPPDDAP